MSENELCSCDGVDTVADTLEKLEIDLNDPVTDPAAFLPFDTHTEALAALESVGFHSPKCCLPFSPSDLVDAVSDLLQNDEIVIMDMTPTIPETASAAYQALTVAGFNAAASCRKDKNAAFLIQKTEKNTPSFLFGAHWGAVQALGKNAAAIEVETKHTPCAYIFYNERQICVTSLVCEVDVHLAARIVAFEITMNAEYFSCSRCCTPFISHVGGDMEIAPMARMHDGKLLLKECALKYVEEQHKSGIESREK